MSTGTYTYPSGFTSGQEVTRLGSPHVGVVTFPGLSPVAPGWVAVSYGHIDGRYIGTLKLRASELELVQR